MTATGGRRSAPDQLVQWQDDPAFDAAVEPVSLSKALRFDLPAGDPDALVTIHTRQMLWLDSLRVREMTSSAALHRHVLIRYRHLCPPGFSFSTEPTFALGLATFPAERHPGLDARSAKLPTPRGP